MPWKEFPPLKGIVKLHDLMILPDRYLSVATSVGGNLNELSSHHCCTAKERGVKALVRTGETCLVAEAIEAS